MYVRRSEANVIKISETLFSGLHFNGDQKIVDDDYDDTDNDNDADNDRMITIWNKSEPTCLMLTNLVP